MSTTRDEVEITATCRLGRHHLCPTLDPASKIDRCDCECHHPTLFEGNTQ